MSQTMISATVFRYARALLAPVLVLFLVAAPSPASAAPVGSVIRGTVVDSAGAPIPNVQVVATELQRVAVTDAAGQFSFTGAPVGAVHLTIVQMGYVPVHEVVTVPAEGELAPLRIVLRRTVLRLPGVQITASPTGTDPLSVTQSTIQLSGKDLQRNLGASVAQTLASEPGIAMRFNGPMANVPVIRGLTGERILTLQDGERVADLSSISADHAVVADPNSAERIEVIRGPASLLYGNSAVGGVVNVISGDIPTTVPGRIGGFVNSQTESVTPGGVVSGALNIPLGQRLAATVRGTFRDQSSYRLGGGGAQPNSDARSWNGTAGLGYVGDRLTAGVVYRQSDFEYGVPFEPGGEGIRIDGVRRGLQARAGLTTGSRALSYLRFEGTVQSYTHDEIEPDGAVGTTFNLKSQTASLTGKTQFGRVSGSIGTQLFLRQYEPIGEEAFTPAADNTNLAAYVYQELPLTTGGAESRTPRLQIGGRFDSFRIQSKAGTEPRFATAQSRNFTNASGSVGLSLPFAAHFTLSGSVSRAFRAPTVEELYSNGFHVAVGTFDVGNPNLSPEISTGLDAVLRAQGSRGFMQFSAYRNAIDDYILPVATGTEDVDGETVPRVGFVQRNATLTGLEFSGETEIVKHVVVGALADAVRGRVGSGGNLPFIPAARMGGSIRYDRGVWSVGGDARQVFSQTRVSTDNATDVPTDSYTMLNLNASWTIVTKRLAQTFTARIDNVLDERYADATSRIKSYTFNPGRNFSLVYRLGF
ncbi:MAG: TonB-dependent receptor [Gemmatimonadaceae bacterium]|nr:TonB-dependent receptor [Gemmatimonadaceae bacterium]